MDGRSREFYFFSVRKEIKIISWEHDFCNHGIASAVKRVENVSNRI